MSRPSPRLVVFTTVFPHPGQPTVGVFIRERMFRVGQQLPLVVVAPVPWFPGQGLLRRWRPHFRPPAPCVEEQQGFMVYHPRFFSVPGFAKRLDGLFLALGSSLTLWRLRRQFGFNLIDAHFAYPDGYAATRLGRWFGVPVTITLRGTETRLAGIPGRRRQLITALRDCRRIFAVATALKQQAEALGIPGDKIRVVGNGVDLDKFRPLPQAEARQALNLPPTGPILISVGGLVERKGFHRVVACLPALRQRFPDLRYLIVGGPGPEGDLSAQLHQQVAALGLTERVHFLGVLPPAELRWPLSAADVFVLSTRNEGWANVFLEAMACGLPVVTTQVGGNSEVVCQAALGTLVPFDDPAALTEALAEALTRDWDRQAIIAYAQANTWEQRVADLLEEFKGMLA